MLDSIDANISVVFTKFCNIFSAFEEIEVEGPKISRHLETVTLLQSEFNEIFSRHSFNAIHINAQSLLKHFVEFEILFNSIANIHAVAVSETWTKPSIKNDLLRLHNFKFYRNDRVSKGAGGVGIYLRNDLNAKILAQSPSAYQFRTEYIILEIKVENKKILLAAAYRPPRADFRNFEEEISKLLPFYEHCLILGDLNFDLFSSKAEVSKFKDTITSLNLSACPLQPTYHAATCDSLLDLILTTNMGRVLKFGQFAVPGISRHDLIFVKYSIKLPKFKPKIISYRELNKIDNDALLADAASLPWHLTNLFPSVDDQLSYLNSLILQLYSVHAPIKRKRVSRPPTPWITDELLNLMASRDGAYRKYRRDLKINPSTTQVSFETYRVLRNRCTQAVRKAKLKFAYDIINRENQNQMWHKLKVLGIRGKKHSVDDTVMHIAPDSLNERFCDTYPPITQSNWLPNKKLMCPQNHTSFSMICVSPQTVEKAINRIKSKATGADEISLELIKKILPFVLVPITNLFNLSITTSTFPTLWKIARVLPLPKTKVITSADDLRPISILPSLSKALENVVSDQIRSYLQTHSLLDPFQSGFQKGRSTATALAHITDDIRYALDNRNITILTLLDFSKAFQSINHNILIRKLSTFYNFSDSSVNWIQSYLTGRSQYVSVSGIDSSLRTLHHGVPQGSVLGPLLFCLYINDLPSVLQHCKYHLYADDFQVYITCSPSELPTYIDKLNEDLRRIVQWSNDNGLKLNPSKSQCLRIASKAILSSLNSSSSPNVFLDGMIIPSSHTVKNLGLICNEHLTWTEYVSTVSKKAFATLHSLSRLKNLLPISLKKMLFRP